MHVLFTIIKVMNLFFCSSLEVWQILASYFYMSSTFPLLIMLKPYLEEKMTAKVLSIMEKFKERSSNIMTAANQTFLGDDGETKSTNMMGLNLKGHFPNAINAC